MTELRSAPPERRADDPIEAAVLPRPTEPTVDALPVWARPARPTVPSPSTRWAGPLVRAGIGLAIAAVMWIAGHHAQAVAVAALLVVTSAASIAFPAVNAGIERAIGWIERTAGRVLTLVLLTLIELLVFAPVFLVMRLLRQDPLADGSSPSDATFWRSSPTRGARPLYRRQFTYESHPSAEHAPTSRFPLARLRAAIGLVVLVLVIDLAAGAAFNAAFDPGGSVAAAPISADAPAGADEPWSRALSAELSEVYDTRTFHPYRGWALADFDGRYVHVDDGVRRSYQPAGSNSARAIQIDFFGGSAMMGWFQRDEHTIASEVARLAEADGILVRPVNRGTPAYQNWQEVILLEELVTTGSVPDLAVFYDGVNELNSQFNHGPITEPTNVNATYIEERVRGEGGGEGRTLPKLVADAWARTSVLSRTGRRLTDLVTDRQGPAGFFEFPWGDQYAEQTEKGEAAASVHGRGVDIARRLGESYGFESVFFWQPFLYSMSSETGEDAAVGSWAADPKAWRTVNDIAVANLADTVVDLSDGLDGAEPPVMYDFIHTNEAGAKVVAAKLYEELRPILLRIEQQR